jgi:hypothetical protein
LAAAFSGAIKAKSSCSENGLAITASDDFGAVLKHRCQAFFSVIGFVDEETEGFQLLTQNRPELWIVFDDQDAWHDPVPSLQVPQSAASTNSPKHPSLGLTQRRATAPALVIKIKRLLTRIRAFHLLTLWLVPSVVFTTKLIKWYRMKNQSLEQDFEEEKPLRLTKRTGQCDTISYLVPCHLLFEAVWTHT